MEESAAPTDPARLAYEAFAPIYDDFNHLNDYELLDVGCGTGRAFESMLRRSRRTDTEREAPTHASKSLNNPGPASAWLDRNRPRGTDTQPVLPILTAGISSGVFVMIM